MAKMKEVHSDLGTKPSKYSSMCNICRNYKSIHDPSHRKSKLHQKKLNNMFCVIRAKMKDIKVNSINIHDEAWQDETKETIFCYFCSESISKHEVIDELKVEGLGYLRHLSSSAHQNGVIKFLKYNFRQEDYKIFCRPQTFVKTFLDNFPDAKRKYLEQLEALNHKDVQKIKNLEAQREELIKGFIQEKANGHTSLQPKSTCCVKTNGQLPEITKIPPWQLTTRSESHETSGQSDDKPVIGPTIDTFIKHVNKRKKKSLPATRLQSHKNMKTKTKINKKWLPPFSGVWNKGRTRQLKNEMKKQK